MELKRFQIEEITRFEEFAEIQNDFLAKTLKQIEQEKFDFFEPYIRQAGIKGEITKGKLKWRGIKMKEAHTLMESTYQLIQRGKEISPIYTVAIKAIY